MQVSKSFLRIQYNKINYQPRNKNQRKCYQRPVIETKILSPIVVCTMFVYQWEESFKEYLMWMYLLSIRFDEPFNRQKVFKFSICGLSQHLHDEDLVWLRRFPECSCLDHLDNSKRKIRIVNTTNSSLRSLEVNFCDSKNWFKTRENVAFPRSFLEENTDFWMVYSFQLS